MNDTTLSTFKEALAELYQGIPEAHRNVQWVAASCCTERIISN